MTAIESTYLETNLTCTTSTEKHSLEVNKKMYLRAASTFLKKALETFPNLVIGNITLAEQKLASMIEKGSHHVHFISDFDMTMTQQWVNGKRGNTTHGVITNYSNFTDSFREKVSVLYNKYYPIEIDPHLPLNEKYNYMEEWWIKAHDVILETGISKYDLEAMASNPSMVWRPKLNELLQQLHQFNVPFLVFSAGLEDLIRPIMQKANLLYPNVDVISNRMTFDEDGFATQFLPPIIHTLNKKEIRIMDHLPHFHAIQSCRTNVIVMGDSLGDADMAHGVAHEVVFKLGFYNLPKNGNLDKYTTHFDLVLTDDLGFDFVIELINFIHDPCLN